MKQAKAKTIKDQPPILKEKNPWLFACLILVVSILFVYIPPHSEFFALDDANYVVSNPFIQKLNSENIKSIFSVPVNGNYHPFTMLSLAIDYHFYGSEAKGYHMTNIIFHILNTLLVFFLLYRLSKNITIAFISAFLFGMHPMHVESVAWISERKDVLYTFFYLSALLCYHSYLRSDFRFKYLIFTGVLFVCSLLSKGQAVTLPIALLLMDYLYGRRDYKKVLSEKIIFLVLSLVFGIIAYKSQAGLGAVVTRINEDHSFFEKILLTCFSLWTYIYKLFIPVNLSVLHPYPARIEGDLPIAVSLSPLFIVALSYLVFKKFSGNRPVLFGIGFFIINIILLLQIIPVGGSLVSERYSYLSYVGLFYVVALGIYEAWKAIKLKSVLIACVSLYLIAIGLLAYQRNKIWSDNKAVWFNVAEQYPDLSFPYVKLGYIYYRESNSGGYRAGADSALALFSKAIDLGWKAGEVYALRGDLYQWSMNYEAAVKEYSESLKFNQNANIIYQRAISYARLGLDKNNLSDYHKSIDDFNQYLSVNPKEGMAYVYLGDLYDKTGSKNKAIESYEKALKLDLNADLKNKISEMITKLSETTGKNP